MRGMLKLHPRSQSAAVRHIEVEVARPAAGGVVLRYVVSGRIGDLVWPAVRAPVRTDELWRHTCFEAFIRPGTGEAYYEFNFSPSTQWATYRFDGYRRGGRAAGEIDSPHITVERTPESFTLQTAPQWDASSELGRAALWRVGLSAVIEEAGGRKSYWALAHPPGKPDFHHADNFALELK